MGGTPRQTPINKNLRNTVLRNAAGYNLVLRFLFIITLRFRVHIVPLELLETVHANLVKHRMSHCISVILLVRALPLVIPFTHYPLSKCRRLLGWLGSNVTEPLKTADCKYVSLLSASILLSLHVKVVSSNLCIDTAKAPLAMGQDKFSVSFSVSISSWIICLQVSW